MTPWGTLLVADAGSARVVEVDMDGTGRSFLHVYRAAGLAAPFAVDCNSENMVVSYYEAGMPGARSGPVVSVFFAVVATLRAAECWMPLCPRLLRDGASGGVVVLNSANRRLLVFGMDGSRSVLWDGRHLPVAVSLTGLDECDSGRAFLVSASMNYVVKVARADGSVMEECVRPQAIDDVVTSKLLTDGTLLAFGEFGRNMGLAELLTHALGTRPGGPHRRTFQVLSSMALRRAWITAAVAGQSPRL